MGARQRNLLQLHDFRRTEATTGERRLDGGVFGRIRPPKVARLTNVQVEALVGSQAVTIHRETDRTGRGGRESQTIPAAMQRILEAPTLFARRVDPENAVCAPWANPRATRLVAQSPSKKWDHHQQYQHK